jgi:hypothetical protein
MPIKHTISVNNDRLMVVATGTDDNLEEVKNYGMHILQAVIENQCKTVLCDERKLVYQLDTMDTFTLAETASEHAKMLEKIAVVCDSKYLHDGKFYETVARNRGLALLVTDNYEQAQNWLEN